MHKELLENLLIEFDEMGYEPTILCDTEREVNSFRNRLKQVLDYLKAIDNSNPSEALECLRQIGIIEIYSHEGTLLKDSISFKPEYDTIKQALLKAQEQEKVLKIIFEKEVNMQVFNQCEDVETYNKVYIKQKDRQLTQEEFELLKRYANDTRTTERI